MSLRSSTVRSPEHLLRATCSWGVPIAMPVAVRSSPESRSSGDAEIGEHRAPAVGVEEHVGGLDVAMHHAAAVRALERLGELAEHAARVVGRHAALEAQPLGERRAAT